MVKAVDERRPKAGLLVMEAGLRAKPAPVPLLGVKVEAEIRDLGAQVRLAQRYCNREQRPIEAVYVFPLDEGAAVCGFEALIDGTHVVGEVKEREAAFETYDDALAEGHGAYLLDQERPDVFTASIGNLPPGKEVTVLISYVTELGLEGDDIRFLLPTTVSPRYAPAEDRKGVGKTPAEAVNPPVDFRVPYGFELTVSLDMPSAIRALESPSHPIAVELDGHRAVVRLGGREAAMDRDFVLHARLAEPRKPRAWVERDEKGNRAAMIAFQPQLEEAEEPSEMVFIIDRSGSMAGASIAEARNALQFCARSLSAGCRFNIVGFGSKYEMLFPESRPYDETSLAEASQHIERMDADLGGTEILAPLQAVLETKPHPELPRQLFVLTDGQVTNTDAVIALVRKHSEATRVFTFGIGKGASYHLIKGMARAGEGAFEFIYPGERIEPKVLRQLRRAVSPVLKDIRVNWGGLRVKQAPHRVPPVFSEERLLVYGFLETGEADDVTLAAVGPKGPLSFSMRVDPEYASRGNLIGTLAARAMIRDLEEGASELHDRGGSLQERGAEKKVRDELVRLGVTYSLCSRETSFVAVEKRETPVQDKMELRKIPVALTRGWGGLEDLVLGATGGGPLQLRLAPAAALPFSPTASLPKLKAFFETASAEAIRGAELGEEAFLVAPVSPKKEKKSERDLDRLVRLQRADGSWDLTAELAKILGFPLARLEERLTDSVGPQTEAGRAWATALALLWLKIDANAHVDEWWLLEKKARRWLKNCPARLATGQEWLEAAAEVLGSA